MCFSCFCHSRYHKSFTPPLRWGFFEDVNFSLWSEALWKKNQGNQIKESGVAYAIN